MRIGIGLPAAVPGADMTTLGQWAAESERAGFAAVGVIDRLVYANLDPLIALAVAAGRTERVDLATTVLSIGWRNNPILVAKQLASLDLVSGGRLLAGLGLGGWPEDYLASQVPQAGNAAGWESSLAAMRQVWDGKLRGQGGPTPELPEGRPALLFGGLVPAAYRRAVAHGQGWVAPLFGLPGLGAGDQPGQGRVAGSKAHRRVQEQAAQLPQRDRSGGQTVTNRGAIKSQGGLARTPAAGRTGPALRTADARQTCGCQLFGHLMRPARTHESAHRADLVARPSRWT